MLSQIMELQMRGMSEPSKIFSKITPGDRELGAGHFSRSVSPSLKTTARDELSAKCVAPLAESSPVSAAFH